MTAVLLYTILTFTAVAPDRGTITTIAWNLPFQTHEICQMFWTAEKQNLLNGVLQYAKNTYKKEMTIKEQGCVTATVPDDLPPGSLPILTDHRPYYKSGTTL